MCRSNAASALCLLIVLAGTVTARPALAQEARDQGPAIEVKVSVAREVVVRDGQGREKVELREAATSGPGDTLVYRITYTNTGSEPAHNARIVDPIPAGTSLLPGDWEAAGTRLTASIDGGRTFHPYPIRRKVQKDDGRTVEEEVAADRYTHLRWTATEPIPGGETREAVFKVAVR